MALHIISSESSLEHIKISYDGHAALLALDALKRVEPRNSPTLLDRLEDLPIELINEVFKHVWDFSITKIGSTYVRYILRKSEHQCLSLTQQKCARQVPMFGIFGHVMRPTEDTCVPNLVRVSLAHPGAMSQYDALETRFVEFDHLIWPMVQTHFPRIRLTALRAFAKQAAIHEHDTPGATDRLIDVSIALSKGQRASKLQDHIPMSNRLFDNHLHFDHDIHAMRFFEADLYRAAEVQQISYGVSNKSTAPLFTPMRYICWARNLAGTYIIAHVKRRDGGNLEQVLIHGKAGPDETEQVCTVPLGDLPLDSRLRPYGRPEVDIAWPPAFVEWSLHQQSMHEQAMSSVKTYAPWCLRRPTFDRDHMD